MEGGTLAIHQPLAPTYVDVHSEDGAIAVPGAGHVALLCAPSTHNVRHSHQHSYVRIALNRVVPPATVMLRPRDAVSLVGRPDKSLHQRAVRLEPVVDPRIVQAQVQGHGG